MNMAIFEADRALERYWTDDEEIHVEWNEISCEEYEKLLNSSPHLSVWSSITDPGGVYGSPMTFTLWGNDNDQFTATVCEYEGDEIVKCHHAEAAAVRRMSPIEQQ